MGSRKKTALLFAFSPATARAPACPGPDCRSRNAAGRWLPEMHTTRSQGEPKTQPGLLFLSACHWCQKPREPTQYNTVFYSVFRHLQERGEQRRVDFVQLVSRQVGPGGGGGDHIYIYIYQNIRRACFFALREPTKDGRVQMGSTSRN